jgi:hypothetical protein
VVKLAEKVMAMLKSAPAPGIIGQEIEVPAAVHIVEKVGAPP